MDGPESLLKAALYKAENIRDCSLFDDCFPLTWVNKHGPFKALS